MAASTRTETDSFGPIEVPSDSCWGARTHRSIENFPFGPNERMPREIVHALGFVKQAAARVNARGGGLDASLAEAIQQAAGEVAAGDHDKQFPLVIWQTGSGTQSNMNANEGIAGRANEILRGTRGRKSPVHPNDHVNNSQTHLQEATPLPLGQEFSGYAAQIEAGIARVEAVLPRLHQLAQGGTAVGTRLHAPPGFAGGLD